MQILEQAEAIEIEFVGFEKILALKSKLVIPRQTITQLVWQSDWVLRNGAFWWRLGGSYIPGVIMAGRYYTRGRWLFAYVKRPIGLGSIRAKQVLVITTAARYATIVVSCDEQTARTLAQR